MSQARFRHFLAIDWSGAVGERHRSIALALAHADGGPTVLVRGDKGWSRAEVLTLLRDDLLDWIAAHHELTGALPDADSGPVLDEPGEAWRATHGAPPAALEDLACGPPIEEPLKP